MLSDSLRQRLEALNRDRLPADTPRAAPVGRPVAPAAPRRPLLAKSELLESAVVTENDAGEHLVMPIPVDDLWPGGEALVADRLTHLQSMNAGALTPGLAPLIAALPDRAVLLDLETCGLSGSALFLVGLLRRVDGRLSVELLFARNYAEERAVMVSLWDRLTGVVGRGAEAIGTFNGKSFDWPMVMDRSRRHLLHKQRELREPTHVDVLHPARRRWKHQLPDCKLQTIERLVCRRTRTGDIPGGQIPAAYDAYVRTGQTVEVEAILNHNALDLVTLLDIAMRVAA
ncbi:MAG: ribonuclease H-like domain-containing protein [Planctomycetota bacterium]